MKRLKKLIFKYRKQIFAFTTIFGCMLFALTNTFAFDDPYADYPANPKYDNYYPYYDEYYKPITNVNMNLSFGHTSNWLVSYPLTSYYLSLFDNDNTTITNIRNGRVMTNGWVHHALEESSVYNSFDLLDYYIYSVSFTAKLDGFSFEGLEFDLGDFWYVPYSQYTDPTVTFNNIRPIFFIDFLNNFAHDYGNYDMKVVGSYSYMGNMNIVEFDTYIPNKGNGEYELTYLDIIVNNDSEESLFGDFVPIYFHDLKLSVNIDTSNLDAQALLRFNMILPIMSQEENNGMYLNNYYLYHNTVENIADFEQIDITWVINGVNGFFSANILPGITLGNIAITFLVASLSVTLLAVINHLK